MSSCFLIANKGDSIDGIYGTLTECTQISKWAGGIGPVVLVCTFTIFVVIYKKLGEQTVNKMEIPLPPS